jgi:phosphoglycerate dehydrogenase-like enzyme
MSNQALLAIAPPDHPWAEAMTAAAERSGAQIVPTDQAEGLIWLGKGGANLRDHINPRTRWVQLRAAGVEHWITTGEIDDDRTFTSARGAYAFSVAEHALALILAAAKRIHACARAQTWGAEGGEGSLLRGSTIGVIGAGGIGQQLIGYLQPFGVDIIAVTRSGRDVPGATRSVSSAEFHAILPFLDYAVLLAPATADTAHLIGRAELASMKPGAWLINLARGSLVDTNALVEGLKAGEIAGAALDVTDPEPLPDGHALWSMEQVLITPHSANPGAGQKTLLAAHVAENVRRFAAGEELLAVVDLEAGY